MLLLRVVGIWVLIVILAIMNGILRETLIAPHIGSYMAHVLSSIILTVLVFAVVSIFVCKSRISSVNVLFSIGALWVVLTILFEFLFGHYVMGHPWSSLFADYNIFRGRLWLLVLLSVFFSPVLAARLFVRRGKSNPAVRINW